MEKNGHSYIKEMEEKKERRKKKDPMAIFSKKPKKSSQKSRVKSNGDKTDKYNKKR
jgi:hypothetical protein